MSRLPTVGGDGDSWGTVLNDYLSVTAGVGALASSPTVAATTFDVAATIPGLRVGAVVAIDAYTTECELRSVSNISGLTVTVDTGFQFAHASGDRLMAVNESVPTSLFGLLGDGSDEWGAMQRLLKESVAYGGLTIRGRGETISVQKPLLVASGSSIDHLILQTRAGFTPADGASGAMLGVGNYSSTCTGTASNNRITTPAAHGLTVSSRIAFVAPYGETFPGNLVAGRWYYVKSVPTSTTMTLSETDGGAEFDITSDGAGWCVGLLADLARVYWESLRLNLTVTDVSGVGMGPQQPSWTRNLRVEMDANATTPGSAFGAAIGGQLSYHDNVEINTSQNCTGLVLTGAGISVRGFNCNGVNSGDTGITVNGSRHTISDIWTEQCGRAGVELVTSVKGCTFDGYWLQSSSSPATAPVLLVSTSTSTYAWNALLRCASSTQLLLSDTARSISLSGANEMDANLCFHGMRQQTGTVGPILNFRGWAFINTANSPYATSRLSSIIKADPNAGDITINLATAVGWLGFQYTVKHSGSGNSVIIDPSGSETIDGASTHTLSTKQVVTIMSDGANWHIMG